MQSAKFLAAFVTVIAMLLIKSDYQILPRQCSSNRQPRQRNNRDVIILAKRNGGLRCLGSVRTRSKKRLQPFEAEDLARRCACFEQTVSIKRAAIARMELHHGLFIGGGRIDAQG